MVGFFIGNNFERQKPTWIIEIQGSGRTLRGFFFQLLDSLYILLLFA
jgi:hypothetical protein